MPTILCIDNDVRFLESEKNALEAKGYTVLIASDAPTGIPLASSSPVDVVVLAIKLSGMDACHVAEALLKEQPQLLIVLCNGYFDTIPEALRWCADACVEKRDGPDALVSAIQQVIGRRYKARAVAA